MIGFALALFLAPPAAEAFAVQATGLSTSAEQSSDPGYDFVASEVFTIDIERGNSVWLYQQNWILGPEADRSAARKVRTRHQSVPYFQVAIELQDFGDGVVHTTTYRIKPEARAEARAFAAGDGSFSTDWLAEVACMGQLRALGDGFWTGQASCPNGYKGGVRVESISVRALDYHINWDRGFDIEGAQIWGPPDGGYVFRSWESSQ